MIPVSVIVTTKNEEKRLEKCLCALEGFQEIIVVDSFSADRTKEIALAYGAKVMDFAWNGRYPKKRQWCCDNIELACPYVFFVDADEIMTPELKAEIAVLDFTAAGYFVRGRYIYDGKLLRHGLQNNKLSLFDPRKIMHPEMDDLDLPMGEIEGHYQPQLKKEFEGGKIGQLKNPLIHDAYDANWTARHERYAAWEAGMNARNAWPQENSKTRKLLKAIFRALPMRPAITFLHCYIFKLGFLDGVRGFKFAQSRAAYYRMISCASKAGASPPVTSMPRFAQGK